MLSHAPENSVPLFGSRCSGVAVSFHHIGIELHAKIFNNVPQNSFLNEAAQLELQFWQLFEWSLTSGLGSNAK